MNHIPLKLFGDLGKANIGAMVIAFFNIWKAEAVSGWGGRGEDGICFIRHLFKSLPSKWGMSHLKVHVQISPLLHPCSIDHIQHL